MINKNINLAGESVPCQVITLHGFSTEASPSFKCWKCSARVPLITVLVVMQDILAYNCEEAASDSLPFPIIADSKRELAVALGMLDPVEKDKDGVPLTARCVSL